jgi:hypothetical protein
MESKEISNHTIVKGKIQAEADICHCEICLHRAHTRVYYKGKVVDFFNLPADKQVESHPFYPVSINVCYSCSLDLSSEYQPLLLQYNIDTSTF